MTVLVLLFVVLALIGGALYGFTTPVLVAIAFGVGVIVGRRVEREMRRLTAQKD